MKHLNISFGVFLAFSPSWLFSADYNPQKTDELKQHLSQFEHAKTAPKYIKIEISKPEFSDKIIKLVSEQADPGVKTDVVQSSALHYAAAANNNNLIYFLWKKGVSINVENNNKSTPLIWAASCGNRKAVALLIRLGADVNIEDTSISTPMSNALQVNDLGTVTELLSAGAEVNFDDFKRTMGEAKTILAACFSIQKELLPNETSLHQAIRLNCPDITGLCQALICNKCKKMNESSKQFTTHRCFKFEGDLPRGRSFFKSNGKWSFDKTPEKLFRDED